ncbi:SIS domain-containing protein [Candidatus Methylomirabilis sp.]|uniref:SIS domain-containing protein n=1 Tax=Candidatus Methylomirabilis sp. TaxID=2032687 RepID=UPI002A5DCADD|nr:SIS domain-containing protein [Candidatus Methylomirabilis sp.]
MNNPAYYEAVVRLLSEIQHSQAEAIDKAADLIFSSLVADGVLHIFGSGHSHSVAEEAFHRAGGLVPVNTMTEPFLSPLTSPKKSGRLERLSGLAAILLDYHEPRPNEVLIIISNAGINPVPIELALEAKKRELTVIAITSLRHAQAVASRHPSGKRLFEVADLVINNFGEAGDGALTFPRLTAKVGPTSLVAGAFIVNSIICGVVERFIAKGLIPPIYLSANLPGGDEHNRQLEAKYKGRIKLLS